MRFSLASTVTTCASKTALVSAMQSANYKRLQPVGKLRINARTRSASGVLWPMVCVGINVVHNHRLELPSPRNSEIRVHGTRFLAVLVQGQGGPFRFNLLPALLNVEAIWRGGKRGMALTTLERYARVKRTLRSEWFLNRSRVWVSRWVRMRGGVQELEVTVGRRRSPQVPREDRMYRQCHHGVVEDEEHFWLHCPRWEKQREELWGAMFEADDMATGCAARE
jgi:hypothetical protein